MVLVDRQGHRWVAAIGAAGVATLVALGVPNVGQDGGSQPGADMVMTVPAPPPPAPPPVAVWPVDGSAVNGSGSAPIDGSPGGAPSGTTGSGSPADVAQAFVREYLGLSDQVVRADPQAWPPEVRFEVVRNEARVTNLIMREVHGSWAVAHARSHLVNVTVEAMDQGALAVHGHAPPGTWVEATVRETGGDFLELARAGAQVGAEGIYALVLRAAPPEHAGGAVVVTTRDRATYSPVEAVAVEPVNLAVDPG